jgi:hypothetical protein
MYENTVMKPIKIAFKVRRRGWQNDSSGKTTYLASMKP